ncbi:hypothetical protein AVEN_8692-1 [Araneus ventricosus]|uniref:CUB domain-containing protein n=1 Tax=Araneus ventricosus TaxID=182803 RepID=A0A4Y2C2X3_ARAVE|nr:hypothetical protein AVEN_8692-1 [Araneus ventricosus]
MWKLALCAIFCYFFIFINSQNIDDIELGKIVTCGQNSTHAVGGFKLSITNLSDGVCRWFIEPEVNSSVQIKLFLQDLFLHENDSVTIFKGTEECDNDTLSIIPPLRAQNGSVTIITNESSLCIKLSGTDKSYIRKFIGFFVSQTCSFPIPP